MRLFHLALALIASHALSDSSNAAVCAPRRDSVQLALADFTSPAEIVMPPAGVRAIGVAVLFAGSDVADMDGAVLGRGGKIVSRPLRQVADRLACAGVATLRYNKRHVTGPTAVEREKFDRLTGDDLLQDGRTALAFIRARESLAPLPVALVGWSEGTTVAMAVSAAEPAVRALALMAPVVDTSAAVAQQQYGRIGRPYLMRFAKDGTLDADLIAKAESGPGGVLPQIFVRMFKGFRPGEKVNPLLDTNHDGRITFSEADPVIASWYADTPDSGLGMSATGRALPGVKAALGPQTPPVLMLQGLNDSMIDPAAALALSRSEGIGQRVMLKTYPGLGHSLGPARSATEDELLPVAAQPLDDIAHWLRALLADGRADGTDLKR